LFHTRTSEKNLEFLIIQRHCQFFSGLRPAEMSLLKTLKVQPKSIAVPLQYLQPVAFPIAEYEDRFPERIKPETALHDLAQTVDVLSHVGMAARQVYALLSKVQHIEESTWHTFASCSASALASTITLYRPISILSADDDGFDSGFTQVTQPSGVLAP
jgi:hypothetical protein